MSSSKKYSSPHPNRFKSPYPEGWVETKKTREIHNDLNDPRERLNFEKEVASHTTKDGWSPTQIENHYREVGYKLTVKNWWDPESGTESMADSPTSPQRGGDPRQARSAHEIGGNGGKKRDSDNSYSYTSGAGSNSYASRPGLQGPSLMPPGISWNDSPYATGYQYSYGQDIGSNYNHSQSYQGTSNGSPSTNYPSHGTGATPSGNHRDHSLPAGVPLSAHPYRGQYHSVQYGRNGEHSSETDLDGWTPVNHSDFPQGRASGGNEQGRKRHGGARR